MKSEVDAAAVREYVRLSHRVKESVTAESACQTVLDRLRSRKCTVLKAR